MEAACDLFDSTLFWDDVHAPYDAIKGQILERNSELDLRFRRLKECP